MPQQRSVGLFGRVRTGREAGGGNTTANTLPNDASSTTTGGQEDNRTVYPCSIHHAGRVGGLYHLFAESSAVRAEWKQKLEEAISLRSIVQESNKVRCFIEALRWLPNLVLAGLRDTELEREHVRRPIHHGQLNARLVERCYLHRKGHLFSTVL